MPRIPLFGSHINRNVNPSSFSGKDQLFVNCYPQIAKNTISGKVSVYMNKRPGNTGTLTPDTGYTANKAAVVWTGATAIVNPLIFSFTNGSNKVQVWRLGGQIGGDIATSAAPVCVSLSETLISGVANLVTTVIDGSTQEGWFFPEGGAWTQIVDGDYPAATYTLVGDPVHMDGFMFVMDSLGGINNSDINSLANWTANQRIVAQSMPDGGVGLARLKNTVVAFGKASIEFFQNAGNASGSPLSPIGNTVKRIGAFDGNSGFNKTIFQSGDTVYFVGIDSESRAVGIYRLKTFEPEKISTEFVDALLGAATGPSLRGVITMHGMTHLLTNVLHGGGALGSLAFCVDTGYWWFMSLEDSGVDIRAAIGNQFVVNADATRNRKIYATSTASPVYQDDSGTYSLIIRFAGDDFGSGDKKFVQHYDLVADNQSSGTTTLARSANDGSSYTTIGTFDMTQSRKRITRCGSFIGQASHQLTHSDNTPWRGQFLDMETKKGAS